jgi:hypothetical protein
MLKTARSFLVGLIVGALLFGGVAFAAEYVINPNSFPIYVNGTQNDNIKALNIDGFTWIQLGSLKEAGLVVKFNETDKIIEITSVQMQGELTMSESATQTAEYSAALPEVNNKDVSMLPEGATFTTFKDCDTAVLYNGETYLSTNDLALKFGITYKSLDDQAHIITFKSSAGDVSFSSVDNTLFFFDKKGLGYYKVSLFAI